MGHRLFVPLIVMIAGFGLAGCGESEVVNSVDVKIVEHVDFTYSAGYGNGCRFKVQIINNTDQQLAKLEAFVIEDGEFLFSVSTELPPMGASTRTHDVQKNKRCREIGSALDLRKNTCSLGSISQDECFAFLQIVPPDA